jgi:hypothetical protein
VLLSPSFRQTGMAETPEPSRPVSGARFGWALMLCAGLAGSVPAGPDHGIYGALAVSVCAGAIIALNQRGLAGLAAIVLGIESLVPIGHAAHPNLLVPIAMLMSACLIGRVLMPRVPGRYWPVIVCVLAVAFRLATVLPGALALVPLLVASALAAHAGFQVTRQLGGGGDMIGNLHYTLADRHWLAETSRYLLLGRIAGGMAHELSQAMNVIGMANGNLGYILARANVAEPYNTELNQRVGKIAAHSSAAAAMLGQFRWFGQDGRRDGVDMTVGTALERAVMATRAATRKTGVIVEIRGDAVTHPAPLRHGLIELLASAALSDLARLLADRPSESAPPQAIALEATRTQTHIEIAVVCRNDGLLPDTDSTGIDRITYDLVARLAASVQGEIRRLDATQAPVRYRMRLPRDII